jgi:hypothetical protein
MQEIEVAQSALYHEQYVELAKKHAQLSKGYGVAVGALRSILALEPNDPIADAALKLIVAASEIESD